MIIFSDKYDPFVQPLRILLIMPLIAFFHSCTWDNEEDLYPAAPSDCDTTAVSYSATIAPIMSLHCNGCHNENSPAGGVITSNWQGLKAVANKGQLYDAVNWTDGINNMPEGQPKLSDCDLAKINKWISIGAPDN